jgi:hypothetical protein
MKSQEFLVIQSLMVNPKTEMFLNKILHKYPFYKLLSSPNAAIVHNTAWTFSKDFRVKFAAPFFN